MLSTRPGIEVALLAALLVLAGCSGGGPATPTGTPDATVGAGTDAPAETGTADAGVDAGTPTETPADVGTNTPTATATATPTTTDAPTPTRTPTPTATPATTPTPTRETTGVDVPGVTRSGAVDPTALVDAHEASLSGEGYVVTLSSEVAGTASVTTTRESRVGADGTYLTTVNSSSAYGNGSSVTYSDGSTTFVRTDSLGEVTYSVVEAGPFRRQATGTTALELYLGFGDYSVGDVRETANGTRVVLRADAHDPAGTGVFGNTTDVESFDSTVVVRPDGRITDFEATINFSGGEPLGTLTVGYELERVGLPTAEAPGWLSTAREQATIVDLTYATEGNFVRITHEGGDRIPNGTNVVVVRDAAGGVPTGSGTDAGFTATLDAGLEPGQTVYLYSTGGFRGSVAYGEPPDVDAAPLPSPPRVTVVAGAETVSVGTDFGDEDGSG